MLSEEGKGKSFNIPLGGYTSSFSKNGANNFLLLKTIQLNEPKPCNGLFELCVLLFELQVRDLE